MHCTTKNIYDKPKSPRHQKVFREKLYAFNQINTRYRFNFTYLNCQCSIINTSATKLKQKPFIRLKKKRKKNLLQLLLDETSFTSMWTGRKAVLYINKFSKCCSRALILTVCFSHTEKKRKGTESVPFFPIQYVRFLIN